MVKSLFIEDMKTFMQA